MYRAIQDYLCSGRCEWMQKWPGMCVLNASQLHWTSETEELLLEQGGEAPQTMLTRQVKRLLLLFSIAAAPVMAVEMNIVATNEIPFLYLSQSLLSAFLVSARKLTNRQ